MVELLLLQIQITAMADDSTSPEKDGFSGEAIVWKFEDNNEISKSTPSPQDGFALNGISFVSGISYDVTWLLMLKGVQILILLNIIQMLQ